MAGIVLKMGTAVLVRKKYLNTSDKLQVAYFKG